MSTPELWAAIAQQADAWATIELVRTVREDLPKSASQRSTGLPGALQRIQASGLQVAGTPLRLGTQLPRFLNSAGGGDEDIPVEAMRGFIDRAVAIEGAHRMTVAWLRSRLPGYPLLPSPQLAQGTPLVTDDFTWRLTWTREELTQRLQELPAPPGVDLAMSLGRSQARLLDAAAIDVVSALAKTPEWDRFAGATHRINDASRSELLAARKQIKSQLAPEVIDAFEPRFSMRRQAYRESTVRDVVETLTGDAADYATSFDEVDRLIEQAASDVFGQLVYYGSPTDRLAPDELNLIPGHRSEVELNISGGGLWPETGTLAWVESPMVQDAIRILSVSVQWDVVEGQNVRLLGEVLPGSASAWHR